MDGRVTPPPPLPGVPHLHVNRGEKLDLDEGKSFRYFWKRLTNLKLLIRVSRKVAGPMIICRLTQGADAFWDLQR